MMHSMPLDTNAMLDEVDADHPGLLRYLQVFAAYVGLPFETLCARMGPALRKLGRRRLEAACAALEEAGVLPELVVETDDHVAAAWSNPILQTCLRYGVSFYPPLRTDIRDVLPPRCTDIFRLCIDRPHLVDPYAPYWRQQLAATLPELYLAPFLEGVRDRYGRTLRGADLACGWGRVSLSLREYEGLTVYACDLSRTALRVLGRLVRNAGLGEHVRPTLADVGALPFDDASLHFFTVFDILEHLPDASFDHVVGEILRCALPGAVVYAEIPLQSKSPAITHVQDFRFTPLVTRIHAMTACGRRLQLRRTHPMLLHHFTFSVEDA